jgi:hypothetical protein
MKIQALKFHCNEEAHLSSLSFLTDLKFLYLKLNIFIQHIDNITRSIHLPCSLQNLYIILHVNKNWTNSEMENLAKSIHEMVKVPFGCDVSVTVYSRLTVITYGMNGVLQHHDNRCLLKSKFIDKLRPYEEDDYFVVKGFLSFSQLLKIQKLIELEESHSEPSNK